MTWREMVGDGAFRLGGENRGVMLGVWWNAALLVCGLIALPFDHRRILGLNPWIKPMKFEVSIIVFLLTMAALLSALGRDGFKKTGRWRRARAWLGWGFGVAMMVEISIIALQSLRGVRSHMNVATALDASLFGVMGGFIGFNTMLVAVLLVLYFLTKTGLPPAVVWGVRLGLVVLLAGSLEGVLMVVHGAHVVGAADGGPGLPFVNWSTEHGDLRVAHFFALHALQTFALTGWGLSRTRLGVAMQVGLVAVVAVVYSWVVWVLFAQAMAGRPVI